MNNEKQLIIHFEFEKTLYWILLSTVYNTSIDQKQLKKYKLENYLQNGK